MTTILFLSTWLLLCAVIVLFLALRKTMQRVEVLEERQEVIRMCVNYNGDTVVGLAGAMDEQDNLLAKRMSYLEKTIGVRN